jgi:hypothetical protein
LWAQAEVAELLSLKERLEGLKAAQAMVMKDD